MAKIRDSKPKTTSGGYQRLLGNKELAEIFTKVQSTVISNGTELEKIITQKAQTIKNLDEFMNMVNSGKKMNGVYLCPKRVIKKSKFKLDKHEPDFIIFSIKPQGKVAHIIELKDGDAFDTKKSAGEKQSLRQFKMHLGSMTEFRTDYKICAFNQLEKSKIVEGFKNEFLLDEVWTGKDLCDELNISYNDIVKQRDDDSIDNYLFVIDALAEMKNIQKKVFEKTDFMIDKHGLHRIKHDKQ